MSWHVMLVGSAHRQPSLVAVVEPSSSNEDIQEQPNLFLSASSSIREPPSSATTNYGKVLQEPVLTFKLNDYSGTPDTPTHCFVPDCTNQERKCIPMYLKKHILTHLKLYITENT